MPPLQERVEGGWKVPYNFTNQRWRVITMKVRPRGTSFAKFFKVSERKATARGAWLWCGKALPVTMTIRPAGNSGDSILHWSRGRCYFTCRKRALVWDTLVEVRHGAGPLRIFGNWSWTRLWRLSSARSLYQFHWSDGFFKNFRRYMVWISEWVAGWEPGCTDEPGWSAWPLGNSRRWMRWWLTTSCPITTRLSKFNKRKIFWQELHPVSASLSGWWHLTLSLRMVLAQPHMCSTTWTVANEMNHRRETLQCCSPRLI